MLRNDKQRFGYDDTGTLIRARQGHSTPVDLQLTSATPPDVLFHGSGEGSVASILEHGLEPRERHHVHLSTDLETARRVGARHGRPAVFRVDTAAMSQAGVTFYLSDNGVWLVDGVPPEFLSVVG